MSSGCAHRMPLSDPRMACSQGRAGVSGPLCLGLLDRCAGPSALACLCLFRDCSSSLSAFVSLSVGFTLSVWSLGLTLPVSGATCCSQCFYY